MVLLVLKLFVSSHPLKLEGVLCIYVLLLHEGQAENHSAMFFYMLKTHTWLSMHYYLWSFVCVTFHVITWLLSFNVKIMSFMPMFRVLWSQHSMLYNVDQDCVGACHLKNYCFVITYLLEDEQELSLGMLDTSQMYLYFFMLHACLYTICFVFCYTLWHLYTFSGTNLLRRCHSASSLFSVVFVFQKSYTGNILEIGWNKSQSSYFSRHEMESKAETEGSQGPATP
jgi:hypothetical protein